MLSAIFRFVRHTLILTISELRAIFLRKRVLLSLMIYLALFTGLIVFVAWLESRLFSSGQLFSLDSPEGRQVVRQIADMGYKKEFELVLKLGNLPGPVVVLQFFTVLLFPTLVALVSCDMVATDIYRGSIRYLVVRTGREVYFLSKLVAHCFAYIVLQALSIAALLVTCSRFCRDFSFNYYVPPALAYLKIFIPAIWFLVATTQFVSCFSAKPARTVLNLHLLWIVFAVVAVVYPPASPFSTALLDGLFLPFEKYPEISMKGFSLWAAGFSLAGLLMFRRRAV